MERRRNGRIPAAIALLIVILACAAAFFGARLITGAGQKGGFEYRTVSLSANQGLEVVDDGFICYDGGALTHYATDGKAGWSCLVGADAAFDASDYGVAAWSGQKLTIVPNGSKTASFSNDMNAEVLSAHVGEKYTAALLGPEHDSTIVLMESGGRRINSITLTSQTVIDYGFLSKGTLLWVMSLDTSGTVPSCTINTYRPGKERVGMIHDNEQLVYGVVFQSSYYCCVGSTFIKVYDYTGNREMKDRRQLVYGWYMAALDDAQDNPIMAFVPSSQYDSADGMHDVRMIRAGVDQQVRMPYGCQSLVARNDRVYGFSTEGYVMIARQGVSKVNAYRLPVQFDRIYGVTNSNFAVLGSGDTVYMLNLA